MIAPAVHVASEVDRCPICASRAFEPIAIPGHAIGEPIFASHLNAFRVCRCACGLILTHPRPSGELLNRFYSSDIYECHKMKQSNAAVRKARSLLEHISRQGPYSEHKRLLDFGCGGGYFLQHAVAAGWSAVGFDVGEKAIESCRSHQLTATDQFLELEPESFDVVVLNHVLEHIEEPTGLLKSLRTLLAPQGKIFIEVPNVHSARARLSFPVLSRKYGFDERYRAFPIHLWYFSRTTLPRLLHAAGFETVWVTTSGMGLEELRVTDSKPAYPSPPVGSRRDVVGAPRKTAKQFIKAIFFGSGLGENLLVAARANE